MPEGHDHVYAITPAERIAKKLDAAEVLRLSYRCPCRCDCGIRHSVAGLCPWCLAGDHWVSLDSYLAKIEIRARETRP